MLLRAQKSGFLLILAFCSFERISSSPQRNLKQNAAASDATLQLATNQTSVATRQLTRLTESYLPAVMQTIAYHIELLQYEPVFSTTIEPPFSGPSTTPPTFPNLPISSSPHPPVQQPVTWWTPPNTTWWSPPSTTTMTTKPTTTSWWSTTTQKPTTTSWWNRPQSSITQKPSYSWIYPITTTTQKPTTTSWWDAQTSTTTQKPTTSSWWNPPSPTTQKPSYSWTFPTTTTQKPTTTSWWNTQTTTTTQKPTTNSWWNPPSPTTQKPSYLWNFPTTTTQKPTTTSWWNTQTTTTTQKPTTTSWWNHPTTQKPAYSWSFTQSPPTSSWFSTTTQKPTTTSWWNAQSTTTTTKKSSYLWTFPTQTPPSSFWQSTTTGKPWQSPISFDDSSTVTTTTPRPSTTTPSWWHAETTSFHKPGYFAPDRVNEFAHPVSNRPISNGNKKPASWKPLQPQTGDLSFLSISNFPFFSHFVQPISKSFVRKPEYEYLHQYPAELLQDIENEAYERPKGNDQEVVNEFRRVYDDFFARVRVFSPITGKKRVPPTRPYVLFLIFYDLCKREAKRLNLQEFSGYSEIMLQKLHETSKYSSERQLYTIMSAMRDQNQVIAPDFNTKLNEILDDLSNPNSVTAMALHILPPLKFEL